MIRVFFSGKGKNCVEPDKTESKNNNHTNWWEHNQLWSNQTNTDTHTARNLMTLAILSFHKKWYRVIEQLMPMECDLFVFDAI